MKIIIRVSGIANCGKTSTIRKFYESLRKRFPDARWCGEELGERGDVRGILDIDGKKVGIEGQGDPTRQLAESLKKFIEEGCDIIFCATRTSRSENYQRVEKLGRSGYDLKSFEKVKSDPAQEDSDNEKMAKEIVGIIVNAL